MKKILKHLLALSAMMLLGTGIANAVNYGVYVGETEITSSNASDVLGDGHVSYDASTKTLTMINVTLDNNGTRGTGIRNDKVDGLVVNLGGINRITSRNTSIYTNKSMEFTGPGTLNCTSTDSYGLGLSGDNITCTISANVSFKAKRNAVYDYNKTATLYLKGNYASLYLEPSNGNSAVYGLGSLTLGNEIGFQYPTNGYFSKSLHSITTDGTTNYKDAVLIAANHLFVGEEKVYATETKDVFGDGQFKYDAPTKTLTVCNANLNNNGALGFGILNYGIQGLTIKLVGNSTFNTRMCAISSNRSFDITGAGALEASCGNSSALDLWGDGITCTIDGPTLDLSSKAAGVNDSYHTATLRVEGSTTNLTLNPSGSGHSTIKGLGNLSLDSGIYIQEPQGGYFSPELQSITTDGTQAYTQKVVIGQAEEYGIVIGDVEVTELNATDVLGNGQFSYDPGSKTLTVTNASLTNDNGYGINTSRVDTGLTIRLVGDNIINSKNAAICSALITITGNGTLTATSTENEALGLFGDCTIDGPQIDLTGNFGCLRDYHSKATLTVKGNKTRLTLKKSGGPSWCTTIYKLKELILQDNLIIIEPNGGYFSPSLQSVTTDGTTVYDGAIVIGKPKEYGLFIGETKVTDLNAADVLNDGKFRYDPNTKTLTVRNATLYNDGTMGNCISNREITGLVINLEGDNYFNARMAAISSVKSFTITGTGTLTGISTDAYAIYLSGDDITCTINGPSLEMTGKSYGLRCYRGNNTLVVEGDNTMVSLMSASYNEAIFNLGSLRLGDNLGITSPKDGYFSEALKSVTADGNGPYHGKVIISYKEPTVKSDVNGDGVTDVADIANIIDIMAADESHSGKGDVNGDGVTDVADIAAVIDIMAQEARRYSKRHH